MTSLDPSHIPSRKETRGQAYVGAPKGQLRLPDLRFEQSYLRSIAPFVRNRHEEDRPDTANEGEKHKTSGADVTEMEQGIYGAPIMIEWKGLLWVTARDQVCILYFPTASSRLNFLRIQIISPFMQGAVWLAIRLFLFVWELTLGLHRGVAALFVLPFVANLRGKVFGSQPKPKRVVSREPSRLVVWVRRLMGSAETNAALRK